MVVLVGQREMLDCSASESSFGAWCLLPSEHMDARPRRHSGVGSRIHNLCPVACQRTSRHAVSLERLADCHQRVIEIEEVMRSVKCEQLTAVLIQLHHADVAGDHAEAGRRNHQLGPMQLVRPGGDVARHRVSERLGPPAA